MLTTFPTKIAHKFYLLGLYETTFARSLLKSCQPQVAHQRIDQGEHLAETESRLMLASAIDDDWVGMSLTWPDREKKHKIRAGHLYEGLKYASLIYYTEIYSQLSSREIPL